MNSRRTDERVAARVIGFATSAPGPVVAFATPVGIRNTDVTVIDPAGTWRASIRNDGQVVSWRTTSHVPNSITGGMTYTGNPTDHDADTIAARIWSNR